MFCEMLSKDLFEYYRSCNKLDEIAQQLQEAVTDEDRVAIAFIHLERINAIPIDDGEKNPTKNTEESIKIRNFGNQAFRKSNSSREALLLYTQSIASARYRSEELALGHSNRSAVLFRRCAYDACLKDIEQAIASRYPEHLKHKLLERREKCLSRQSGGQACQDSVKSADGESGEMADGDLVQAPWSDDVQSCDPRDMETRAYTVKSNIDYGRYLIATRDIKPGDIVDFEKPYASIVWPEFVYTHCSNCLMRCDNLIPCKHCSLVSLNDLTEEVTNMLERLKILYWNNTDTTKSERGLGVFT